MIRFRSIDAWPGQLRTSRVASPFSAGWTATLALLADEVRMIGGSDIVVQVAADCYVDGSGPKPSARWAHPGVIVSYESKFGAQRMHTDQHEDRWGYLPGWQANVRAVALALKALRAVDRYGCTNDGEQYRGFGALGSGTPMGPAGSDAFGGRRQAAAEFMAGHSGGVVVPADLLHDDDAVRYVFKVAAKTCHPDHGGTSELYRTLTEARRLLLSTA